MAGDRAAPAVGRPRPRARRAPAPPAPRDVPAVSIGPPCLDGSHGSLAASQVATTSRLIRPEYVGWWHLTKPEMWDLDLGGAGSARPSLLSIGSPRETCSRHTWQVPETSCILYTMSLSGVAKQTLEIVDRGSYV